MPRTLIFDIENVPLKGYTWRKWKTDLIEITDDWFMLSFAYKWLGETTVRTVALPDFPVYQTKAQQVARQYGLEQDDSGVAKALRDLFDEADIVVAHNGVSFDQPKAKARFSRWHLDPPSPFREVDTKQVAARGFRFESNSLKDLCRIFEVEAKGDAGGWETWKGCIQGDPAAWKHMLRYNKQDVRCLEQVYMRLLPWVEGHPNVALIDDRLNACPKCGSEKGWKSQGWRYYSVTKRRVWRCKNCGGCTYSRKLEKSDVARVS